MCSYNASSVADSNSKFENAVFFGIFTLAIVNPYNHFINIFYFMKNKLFVFNRIFPALIAIFLLSAFSMQARQLLPFDLRCEYNINPLGIDESNPSLSWKLTDQRPNSAQTAYEIEVSTSLKGLQAGSAEVWKSGKVNSSENIHIRYAGNDLKPFTCYYWRVRSWDADGEVGEWSKTATFETAMLSQSDWEGEWIGDERLQFTRDEDFYQEDPMPLFRKEFGAAKRIASARLYICGLGYYEAYINGKRVGENLLDPGWTANHAESHYVTYDITQHLKQGRNAIGVMLGNGWWNPLPLRLFREYNLRDVQETGRPCLKARILMRYSDGSEEWVNTDESWLTTQGPIVLNNVYLGEKYDARCEVKDFSKVGINKSAWKPATKVKGPSGILVPRMQPPVQISNIVKPVAIIETEPGIYTVDLGQNFAGVARINVKAPKGTEISLRYAEIINDDNTVNTITTNAGHIKAIWGLEGGPGAPATAEQISTYIAKGEGKEVWYPRFTFHGFRYIEVKGWPGKLTKNDIEGLQLHPTLEQAGQFSCSNEMLNRLNGVIDWTFKSNLFSVQSDCPAREKMGYGGDIVATSDAFIYNYDMANFYRKTIRDFANDQTPMGGMPEIAPNTGIALYSVGDGSGPVGWQLAYPYLLDRMYEMYGDKRIIETQFPIFERQIKFLDSVAEENLFDRDISDHESIDPRPISFSANCFYYHHVLLFKKYADLLGKEDAIKYADDLLARVKRAIVSTYYVPNTGRFDNATQAAQVFGLYYDLSPQPELTFDWLMKEIDRWGGHLSTGIFTTKMMFDVLRDLDRNDVSYTIINQRDYPGWGFMLDNDATTLWESWEKPVGASYNHPMFGQPVEWYYRSLLGINPATPGFKTIQIKPMPVGDLTWAKGSYESLYGTIASGWEIKDGVYTLEVTIPTNTKADVYIPAESNTSVEFDSSPSLVSHKGKEGRYQVFEVGSGTYRFYAPYHN
jgi:Alpha-L-rhamnosidase N-terminal domain./Bacterial alpha-L-rhamnosidase.